MSERRSEVLWVPSIPDQFVTWGSDIRLYTVVDGARSRGIDREQIGPDRYAELLSCVKEPHYIKCVDLWKGQGVLMAVGQATGRISLIPLSEVKGDILTAERDEYLPRQSRVCNNLAWHPTNLSLLAAGFDKVRTEYGIVVWDLGQHKLSDKPVFEVANADQCNSVSWIHGQPSLVAGLSAKTVRVFDTRTNMKVVNQTKTSATFGVSVDPGSEHRISGYSDSDNSVVIWDTRNFEKPIVTLPSPHPVTKVAWCPTRRGLLANSVRDSDVIMLRDIMSWAVTQEDGEASVTERRIQPPSSQLGNIADFAWHPGRENTLLAMGSWNKFAEWTVADRLTLNWSPRHDLVWSSVGSTLRSMRPVPDTPDVQLSSDLEIEDVGVLMQCRARMGYAGEMSLPNLAKFKLGTDLETVWSWILHASTVPMVSAEYGTVISSFAAATTFSGIRALLHSTQDFSQSKQCQWQGIDSPRTIRTFVSAERDLVLKLCGWDRKRAGKTIEIGEVSRQATLSVFNLDLATCITTLKKGSEMARARGDHTLADSLNMVSLAVSGFSAEGSKLWREVVSSSLAQLPDPALRSLFAFLTAEDDEYTEVLNQENLPFTDRIAFAVRFLSDKLLQKYLDTEWTSLLNRGSIEALLLSSSQTDSLDVLQAYVDKTGDVQSASWICVKILPAEKLQADRVTHWLHNYRQILDQWNMFAERAELDIWLSRVDPSWETQQQIYIACNFCGKSISHAGKPRTSKTGSLNRQSTVQNKSKAQACPSCRKPLPRCAVCLVNMGTMSGLSNQDDRKKVVTRFGEWFTWCQTCRHGGHADHLLEWFGQHTVCPVTGCACKCASLDASAHIDVS